MFNISWHLNKKERKTFFFLLLNITWFFLWERSTDHFEIRAQFYWLHSSPAYQFVFRLTHWHSVFINNSNTVFWFRVFCLFYWSGAASQQAWRFCDETDTQRSRVRGLLLFKPAGNAAALKRHIQSPITSKNTPSTQVSGARFKSSRGYVHPAVRSYFSLGNFVFKTALCLLQHLVQEKSGWDAEVNICKFLICDTDKQIYHSGQMLVSVCDLKTMSALTCR